MKNCDEVLSLLSTKGLKSLKITGTGTIPKSTALLNYLCLSEKMENVFSKSSDLRHGTKKEGSCCSDRSKDGSEKVCCFKTILI